MVQVNEKKVDNHGKNEAKCNTSGAAWHEHHGGERRSARRSQQRLQQRGKAGQHSMAGSRGTPQ